MMTRTRLTTALIVAAACVLPSIADAKPWATVNGEALDDQALVDAVQLVNERLGEGRTMTPEQRSALKSRLAREALADKLIEQRIAQERLKASDKALAAALKRHKQRFNHDQGFTAFLGVTGHTEASFKAVLLEGLIARLLKTKPPTMADVKQAIKKDPDQFRLPESVRARQILIVKPAGADEAAINARRDRAKKLYRNVAKTPQAFADLAMSESEGPAAKQGGQLGKLPRGRMGEVFDRVVFRADPGTVVGPIETPTAFHIVLVEARFGEEPARFVKPTTVATDVLYQRYQAATWAPLMRRLFGDAKITIHDPEVKVTANDLVALKASEHLVHEGPSDKTSAHAHGQRARPSKPIPKRPAPKKQKPR